VHHEFAAGLLGGRYPELVNDDRALLERSFLVVSERLGDVAATPRAGDGTLERSDLV
jgi:hypothetical protein